MILKQPKKFWFLYWVKYVNTIFAFQNPFLEDFRYPNSQQTVLKFKLLTQEYLTALITFSFSQSKRNWWVRYLKYSNQALILMSYITSTIIWKNCFIMPSKNKHLYSINIDISKVCWHKCLRATSECSPPWQTNPMYLYSNTNLKKDTINAFGKEQQLWR